MDVRDLRVFLTVVRTGSMSQAAAELHYVQSNVTARIKHLEEHLGTRLLHRARSGVVPTPAGRELQDYAERILRLVADAEAALSGHRLPQGQLIIGSMETTAAARLPKVLAAFHRQYPDVDLRLQTGTSAASLQRLQDGVIDAALVSGEVPQDRFETEAVFEEELMLVSPPCALGRGAEDLDTLRALKILVFGEGCSYRRRLAQWLQETGRVPFQVMEFGSIEGILGCVAAGMGVSLLPRVVVDRPQYHDVCVISQLPPDVARMTTWLVRRKAETPSRAMQAFRDQVFSDA